MIAITLILIFASFSTAATLAIWTYQEILKTTTLSNKYRSVQFTLLVAVCAQVNARETMSRSKQFSDICAARLRVHSVSYVHYFAISKPFRYRIL